MADSAPALRTKLACTTCSKRKVKCSKTFPCVHCVRRGEQATCRPDGASSPSPRQIPSKLPTPTPWDLGDDAQLDTRSGVDDTSSTASPRESAAGQRALESLRRRTAEHEGQRSSQASASPSALRDGTIQSRGASNSIATHAASILEFFAWGRRKEPVVIPDASVTVQQTPDQIRDQPALEALTETFDARSNPALLQLLLPSRQQVWQLVEYHQEAILWYDGSYYAPAFRSQLEAFYIRHDGFVDSAGINSQWVALLFAVLTVSLTCAPIEKAEGWGFHDPERETLSRRWFQATISCLNRAEYATNHSIFSCQAIATLTLAAHTLGFSNTQSIHLAAAVRVAQSLGLHRLGRDTAGGTVEKETGRRVWCQLCTQDWFSIPFFEGYLINPLHTISDPPANCRDEDMITVDDNVPTMTSYCRFLLSIAAIMPKLHDGLVRCNTTYTRYEQILTSDARLRSLLMSGRPEFLLGPTHFKPEWPVFIPWARRALAISLSHKVIMIHRSFLWESFTDDTFGFTRRTCISAAKTIIKEYKAVVTEDGPNLWIYPAFAVAGSIILLLDALHREPGDPQRADHILLAQDVVSILEQGRKNMVGVRGARLLTALLQVSRDGQSKKRSRDDAEERDEELGPAKKARTFDVLDFVKTYSEDTANQSGQNEADISFPDLQASDAFDFNQVDLSVYFPHGLEMGNGFDNLLYLASHNFPMH